MPRRDPHIDRRTAFQTRQMQALSRVAMPLVFASPRLHEDGRSSRAEDRA
jgi:hypothetical protein